MKAARFPHRRPGGRAGVTLIEVLAAIFITGVGLLALLVLFPLGALSLAQAIQDDRTAAVAQGAVALGQTGTALVSDTGSFVAVSLAARKADPQAAAALRERYEALDDSAAELEAKLIDLGPVIQDPKWRLRLQVLVAQVKAIRAGAGKMIGLLGLLAGPNPPP
jgi:hypothetical protein